MDGSFEDLATQLVAVHREEVQALYRDIQDLQQLSAGGPIADRAPQGPRPLTFPDANSASSFMEETNHKSGLSKTDEGYQLRGIAIKPYRNSGLETIPSTMQHPSSTETLASDQDSCVLTTQPSLPHQISVKSKLSGNSASASGATSPTTKMDVEAMYEGLLVEATGKSAPCLPKKYFNFKRVAKVVESKYFHSAVSMLILANASVIIFDSDNTVRQAIRSHDGAPTDALASWQLALETFFIIVFTCELVLRMIAEEFSFWVGSGWRWNLFDFTLVACSMFEAVLDGIGIDATFARILRVARMSRTMRMVRMFRSFHELRVLMDSVCHIMFPLIWASLALSIVIIIFSVIFLHAISAYLSGTDIDENLLPGIKMYFSSLPMAFLSLFMSLTNGQSWWYIAEPLLGISNVYAVVFAIFVTFLQLGVLNIITGIFVESAASFTKMDGDLLEYHDTEQRQYMMSQLQAVFDMLDQDGSGIISKSEFREWTSMKKVVAFFEHILGLEAWKVSRFFDMLDVNVDGAIEKDEFIVGCMRLRGVAKNMDQEVMMHVCGRLKKDLVTIKHALSEIKQSVKLHDSCGGERTKVHAKESL